MEAIKLHLGFPEWAKLPALFSEINVTGKMFAYGIDHNTAIIVSGGEADMAEVKADMCARFKDIVMEDLKK